MNPPDQPPAVPPPKDTIPALLRGHCERLEHDLSQLAWLLACEPAALPKDAILSVLNLAKTVHELRSQIRD